MTAAGLFVGDPRQRSGRVGAVDVEGELECLSDLGRCRRRRWWWWWWWWWSLTLTGDWRGWPPVGGDAVVAGRAVRLEQGDPPPAVHLQRPSAFVDEMVVPFADGQQVVEIGGSAAFPERDVVDAAVLESTVQSGMQHVRYIARSARR